MTRTTLDAIVHFVDRMPLAREPLPVVWHAGEPLAVPISFYAQAFTCFSSGLRPIPAQHHFQTNATLLNDQWCRFIKESSVLIGVSIDGPRDIHNAYRVDRLGRGTFDRVMRGISKLREHDIPFTVLSVITRATLTRPDEVWEFLVSLGASYLSFNVEEAEGVHMHSSLAGADLDGLTRHFFSRIAELQSSTPRIRVRELENMRLHVEAPPGSTVMRANNRPGAILNVDASGNITTLSPELLGQMHPRYGKFRWGNVHTDSWADVVRNPQYVRAQQDVNSGIARCKESCSYFPVCGGGNPSNKLAELGTLAGTETQHCRLHVQALADVVRERIEQRRRFQI